MAYRSWLKDVKSVHDLGEHCHTLTFRKPEDDAREAQYIEKLLKRGRANIPVADEFKFAFGSRMHDSWVEWIKRTPKELRLRINNDLAQHFVGLVTSRLDIHIPTFLNTKYRRDIDFASQPKDWIAPVDLIFEDPIYVNAVYEDSQKKLRWAKWEDIGRRGPYEADQFRSNWFFEQDGRIQCIIELKGAPYLLIDCSRVRAEDGRATAISQILGPGAVAIWNDMMAGIDLGEKWDGWSKVGAYIDRRMEAHGFTIKDLRPKKKGPLADARGPHK